MNAWVSSVFIRSLLWLLGKGFIFRSLLWLGKIYPHTDHRERLWRSRLPHSMIFKQRTMVAGVCSPHMSFLWYYRAWGSVFSLMMAYLLQWPLNSLLLSGSVYWFLSSWHFKQNLTLQHSPPWINFVSPVTMMCLNFLISPGIKWPFQPHFMCSDLCFPEIPWVCLMYCLL